MLQSASLFVLRVGWLVSAWYGFFAGGDFGTGSSTFSTFLLLLTLLFNIFRNLQVTALTAIS